MREEWRKVENKLVINLVLFSPRSFVCPHCTECTNIFSSNGGVELATLAQVPHLGTLPIDPRLGVLAGTTASVLNELPDSSTAHTLRGIVQHLEALTAAPTPA